MSYVVTIREGSTVHRERFAAMDDALEHLEGTLRPLAAVTDRDTVKAFAREIEPAEQVIARGEISGPRGMRAGIDVHGDGSTTAYTGRVRRTEIEQHRGEDAFQALRRRL
ncbi:MAG TPA: hypothetical protein VNT22_03625 [Baekduia sp.]|nr:hypothetical protein [Baekduia sp.]